jgi:hypothetical protein
VILIIGVNYEHQFCCSCTADEDPNAPISPEEGLKILLADKTLPENSIEHILIVRNDVQEGFHVTPRDIDSPGNGNIPDPTWGEQDDDWGHIDNST